MSKIEVDQITQQSGSTLTVGGGACKTATVDATTVTLGRSGGTVSLASGATQSGFGRTGTVDWDTTPKTATFTAVSGDGFFCNTTSSAFTCNLPAGSAGAIVSLADYAGTWQTNNLTVSPNGSDKIGGVNADVILNTEGQSVTFVFVDSTQGWVNVQDSTSNERANAFMVATGGTITTCGNDKIHTFTGPGTFTVCSVAACATNNIVSHLVVAGGGGGSSDVGGGGGAGGYREVKNPVNPFTASPLDGYPSAPNRVTVTATAYPITVGGGGAGTPYPPQANGTSGANSIFSTVTSAGGGGGAGSAAGLNGGSGGGGYRGQGNCSGGSGNTPPVTPAQGKDGGDGAPGGAGGSGGGGGAIGVGGNGNADNAGGAGGGPGATSCITGSPVARAGGGGGGTRNAPSNTSPGGGGGTGGGGAGSGGGPTGVPGSNATDNTGGGGGGAVNAPGNGGNGGSGIVVIRYKYQ